MVVFLLDVEFVALVRLELVRGVDQTLSSVLLTCTRVNCVLGDLPLVECVAQANEHEGTQDDKHDNPGDGDFVSIVSWWLWNEWIDTLRQGFISNISIQESVSSDIESCSLLWVVSNCVVIFKNTEELLEEHATQNDVGGLRLVFIQIINIQIAKLVAATDEDFLGESSQRHAHVHSINGIGEVETESELFVGGVIRASTWQLAEAVNSVFANHLILGHILEQSHKLRVQSGWQTQSHEIGCKGDWVSLGHLVEELTVVLALIVRINTTECEITQRI